MKRKASWFAKRGEPLKGFVVVTKRDQWSGYRGVSKYVPEKGVYGAESTGYADHWLVWDDAEEAALAAGVVKTMHDGQYSYAKDTFFEVVPVGKVLGLSWRFDGKAMKCVGVSSRQHSATRLSAIKANIRSAQSRINEAEKEIKKVTADLKKAKGDLTVLKMLLSRETK